MSVFSKQKYFCNACGVEFEEEFSKIIGRDWKVCSRDCLLEMQWRQYLSQMGKPYKPQMTDVIKPVLLETYKGKR